jgi:glutamine amidotransferase
VIAIINYGMGNVASVEKAVSHLGYKSVLTSDQEIIRNSSCIILPGVGAFAQGMANLNQLGLVDILNKEVLEHKKPFLGICLGMQLIASKGYENAITDGLGWIQGEVRKIEGNGLSVPHLGWNNIKVTKSSVFDKFNDKDFYFIHSYYFDALNPLDVSAIVNYGIDLPAIIHKENIFATQFHPEKSQNSGLSLIKYFLDNYVKS